MGNVVSSINVLGQIGQEATIGQGGAAGTLLRTLRIEPGDELTIRQIEAQGHRFDTGTVKDKQWVSWQAVADALSYTEHLYLIENILGTVAPTSPGTNTKKRVYTAAVTGSITPKTNVFQWGDASDNVNILAYVLGTDYGESWDRESGVKLNGAKGIGQIATTGGAFTASPTSLAQVPIGAADFNVYLDTSWANLGTTQITDEINMVDWSLSGMKAERWSANRSKASFAGHVDIKPKTTLKITIYEGTVARPIISALETGSRYFLRLDGQSPTLIDNYFLVSLGSPSAGNFTLTYKSQTTANIAFNATAAQVAAALQALSAIGANGCTVSGSTGGPYTVTMTGSLASDTSALTGSGAGLTGGTFLITTTQLPYMAQRDFSLLLTKVSPLKDNKGVYGRDLEFTISEDPTSSQALRITSQTAIASL